MEDVSGRPAQLEIRMAIATLLQHCAPVFCDKSVVSRGVGGGGGEQLGEGWKMCQEGWLSWRSVWL